ncbi:MAG: hypothetical protein EXQ94_09340 [Alphaproteobacteria bacterium]|nr:hypothetical protein [Alphaproteobacteria bacterium]
MGDRLGHVLDASRGSEHARGYRSAKELNPHTNSDDIVGLLCLRGAKSGGESLLTSSLAVHNALAREEPEHLPRLHQGFPYHWNGEEPPGEPPITPYDIPAFAAAGGLWSTIYLRYFIDMAAGDGGVAEPVAKAALDAFDARAKREDLQLPFPRGARRGVAHQQLHDAARPHRVRGSRRSRALPPPASSLVAGEPAAAPARGLPPLLRRGRHGAAGAGGGTLRRRYHASGGTVG